MTTTSWPLQQPTHDQVPEGDGKSAWKDNAYISFWDPGQDAYGTLHVSTSPNAEGRRARVSLSVDGTTAEVIEPLEPASFASESIEFDLDSGTVTVDASDLSARFETSPRLALADYTPGQVIPPMGGAPVHHYQTTVDLTGPCTINGSEFTLDATGIRDRTWGYRDESIGISEYAWFFATFPDFSLTAMRFIGDHEFDSTDGFVMTENEARQINSISITRDASGLCAEVTFGLVDGGDLSMRSTGRRGGFWIPMSWERQGPTMSAYDEFCGFRTSDGIEGFGVAEHGSVRRLF
jgi:hypothetical protein